MTNYTKNNIGSGYNTTTSLNAELEKVETAVNSKLDKTGGSLSGDLSMESNDLLNVNHTYTAGLTLNGEVVTSVDSLGAVTFPSLSSVTYTNTGTGATGRPLQDKLDDVVSVKDFGAVGDGVTDDTTAIQAALDSGAKSVFIPKGSYALNSGITVPSAVELKGEGMYKTTLVFGISSGNAVAIGGSTSATNSSRLADLSITNTNGSTGTSKGLVVLDNTRNGVRVDSVSVGDFSQIHFDVGFELGINCYQFLMEGCNVFYNKTSFDIKEGSNIVKFSNTWFKGNGVAGGKCGYIRGSSVAGNETFDITFVACGFEFHDSGLSIGASTTDFVYDVNFFGGYWESNKDYHIDAHSTRGLNIIGGYFQHNNNMTSGIVYNNNSWGTCQGLIGNNVATGGYFMKSTSAGNRVTLFAIQDAQGTNRGIDPSGTWEISSEGGTLSVQDAVNVGSDMSLTGSTFGRAGAFFTVNADNNIDVDVPTNRKLRIQGELGVNGTAVNTNTPSGATARQWPIYSETGAILGYVPIYGSAW